eukprot:5505160-Pyramimonas_sp.AAC.1
MESPMRSWTDERSVNETATHLRRGIYNSLCCGATTVYADDIFDTMPIDETTQTKIDEKLKHSDDVLDGVLGAKGLIQNYSKRETVPCLRSHQANRDFSA